MSAVFTAQYPGRCHADCGQTIEPGDDVTYDGMRFDVLEVEGSRIERIAVEFIERPTARRSGDNLLAPEDDLE